MDKGREEIERLIYAMDEQDLEVLATMLAVHDAGGDVYEFRREALAAGAVGEGAIVARWQERVPGRLLADTRRSLAEVRKVRA